jgi:hypothetical protein
MAKGGARPGEGRPKGSKTTPRFRNFVSDKERKKLVEFILDQYMSDMRRGWARSPDAGDTFIMRMYFELLKGAAGNPNAPYDRSVRELNMRRPGGRRTEGGLTSAGI